MGSNTAMTVHGLVIIEVISHMRIVEITNMPLVLGKEVGEFGFFGFKSSSFFHLFQSDEVIDDDVDEIRYGIYEVN